MNEELSAAKDLAETLKQHGYSDRVIQNILQLYQNDDDVKEPSSTRIEEL